MNTSEISVQARLINAQVLFADAIKKDQENSAASYCLNCKSENHTTLACPLPLGCFNCRGAGHAAYQCTENPTEGAITYIAEAICGHCGGRGHSEKFCKAVGGRLYGVCGASYIPATSFPSTLVIHTPPTLSSVLFSSPRHHRSSSETVPYSTSLPQQHTSIDSARKNIIQILKPILNTSPSLLSSSPSATQAAATTATTKNQTELTNNNKNNNNNTINNVDISKMRNVELFQFAMPFATLNATSSSYFTSAKAVPSSSEGGGGGRGEGGGRDEPTITTTTSNVKEALNNMDTTGGVNRLFMTGSASSTISVPHPPPMASSSASSSTANNNNNTLMFTESQQDLLRKSLEVLRPTVVGSISLLEGMDPQLVNEVMSSLNNQKMGASRPTMTTKTVRGGVGGGPQQQAYSLSEMRMSNLDINVYINGEIREFRRGQRRALAAGEGGVSGGSAVTLGEVDPNNPVPYVSPFYGQTKNRGDSHAQNEDDDQPHVNSKEGGNMNQKMGSTSATPTSDGINSDTAAAKGRSEQTTIVSGAISTNNNNNNSNLIVIPKKNSCGSTTCSYPTKEIILDKACDTISIQKNVYEITRFHKFLPQSEILRRQKIKADREAELFEQQRRQHAAVARMARRQQREGGGKGGLNNRRNNNNNNRFSGGGLFPLGQKTKLTGSALNANQYATSLNTASSYNFSTVTAGALPVGGGSAGHGNNFIGGEFSHVVGLGAEETKQAIAEERRYLIEKQIQFVLKGAENEYAAMLALNEEREEEEENNRNKRRKSKKSQKRRSSNGTCSSSVSSIRGDELGPNGDYEEKDTSGTENEDNIPTLARRRSRRRSSGREEGTTSKGRRISSNNNSGGTEEPNDDDSEENDDNNNQTFFVRGFPAGKYSVRNQRKHSLLATKKGRLLLGIPTADLIMSAHEAHGTKPMDDPNYVRKMAALALRASSTTTTAKAGRGEVRTAHVTKQTLGEDKRGKSEGLSPKKTSSNLEPEEGQTTTAKDLFIRKLFPFAPSPTANAAAAATTNGNDKEQQGGNTVSHSSPSLSPSPSPRSSSSPHHQKSGEGQGTAGQNSATIWNAFTQGLQAEKGLLTAATVTGGGNNNNNGVRPRSSFAPSVVTATPSSFRSSSRGGGGGTQSSVGASSSVASLDKKLKYLDEDGNDARNSVFVVPRSKNLILTTDALQDRIMQEWGYSYARAGAEEGFGVVKGEANKREGGSEPKKGETKIEKKNDKATLKEPHRPHPPTAGPTQRRPSPSSAPNSTVGAVVGGGGGGRGEGTSLKNFRNVSLAHKTHKAAFNQWVKPRTPRPPPPQNQQQQLGNEFNGGTVPQEGSPHPSIPSSGVSHAYINATSGVEKTTATYFGGGGGGGGGRSPGTNHINLDDLNATRIGFGPNFARRPPSPSHTNNILIGGNDSANGNTATPIVENNLLKNGKEAPTSSSAAPIDGLQTPEITPIPGQKKSYQATLAKTSSALSLLVNSKNNTTATPHSNTTNSNNNTTAKRIDLAQFDQIISTTNTQNHPAGGQTSLFHLTATNTIVGGGNNDKDEDQKHRNFVPNNITIANGNKGQAGYGDPSFEEQQDPADAGGMGTSFRFNVKSNKMMIKRAPVRSWLDERAAKLPPEAKTRFTEDELFYNPTEVTLDEAAKALEEEAASKATGIRPIISSKKDSMAILLEVKAVNDALIRADERQMQIVNDRNAKGGRGVGGISGRGGARPASAPHHQQTTIPRPLQTTSAAALFSGSNVQATFGVPAGSSVREEIRKANANTIFNKVVGAKPPATATVDIGPRADPNIVLKWKMRFRNSKVVGDEKLKKILTTRDAHRAVVAFSEGELSKLAAKCEAGVMDAYTISGASLPSVAVVTTEEVEGEEKGESHHMRGSAGGGGGGGQLVTVRGIVGRPSTASALSTASRLTTAATSTSSSLAATRPAVAYHSGRVNPPPSPSASNGLNTQRTNANNNINNNSASISGIASKAAIEAQRKVNARKQHVAGKEITNMWTEHCKSIAKRAAEDKIRLVVRKQLIEYLERLTGLRKVDIVNNAAGFGFVESPSRRLSASASLHGPTAISPSSPSPPASTPASTSVGGGKVRNNVLVAAGAIGRRSSIGLQMAGGSGGVSFPLSVGAATPTARRFSSASVSVLSLDDSLKKLDGNRTRSGSSEEKIEGTLLPISPRFEKRGEEGGGRDLPRFSPAAHYFIYSSSSNNNNNNNNKDLIIATPPLNNNNNNNNNKVNAERLTKSGAREEVGEVEDLTHLPPLKRLQKSLIRLKTDEGRAIVTALYDGLSSVDEGGFMPAVWEKEMRNVGNGVVLRRESVALIQSIFSSSSNPASPDTTNKCLLSSSSRNEKQRQLHPTTVPNRRDRGTITFISDGKEEMIAEDIKQKSVVVVMGGGKSDSIFSTQQRIPIESSPQRKLRRASNLMLSSSEGGGGGKGAHPTDLAPNPPNHVFDQRHQQRRKSFLLSPEVMRRNQLDEDEAFLLGKFAEGNGSPKAKELLPADDGHRDFNYYRNLALRDQYLRREEQTAAEAREKNEERKRRRKQYKMDQRHQTQFLQQQQQHGPLASSSAATTGALFPYTPKKSKLNQTYISAATKTTTGSAKKKSSDFTFGTPASQMKSSDLGGLLYSNFEEDARSGDDDDDDENDTQMDDEEEEEENQAKEKGIVISTLDDVKDIIAFCCDPHTEPESAEGKKILSFVLLLLNKSGLLTADNTAVCE